jgi:hypothetical protein
MSTRSKESFQSPLTTAERGTRRASDATERNEPVSLPGGHGASVGGLEGKNATFSPRYDRTTHTHLQADEETETCIPVLKEDGGALFTPSTEVNGATPLSQKNEAVERMYSSAEYVKTILLPGDENAVVFHPPEQDNRAASSRAMATVEPPGSIKDDSTCEHQFCCVSRYWH